MITDALIDFGFTLANWLMALLPSFEWTCSGVGDLATFLRWVNTFADLLAWATVLGLMLTAEVTVLAVKLIVWIYDLIPFKFT